MPPLELTRVPQVTPPKVAGAAKRAPPQAGDNTDGTEAVPPGVGRGAVGWAQDGGNDYICRWNPLESNFRLYKLIDGNRIQLTSAEATAEGGWHELHATMTGTRIECRFDGELLLQAEDGALTGPGQVGLWTKADAVTLFDGLRVTYR